MQKKPSYSEKRVLLSSPSEIKRGDRLQRNSEALDSIEELDMIFVVADRWGKTELPKDKPVHVWRSIIS